MPAAATVSISESESMAAVLLRGFAAVSAAVHKPSGSGVEALTAWRSFSKAAAAACRSALASSCQAMQHLRNLLQTVGGGGGGVWGVWAGLRWTSYEKFYRSVELGLHVNPGFLLQNNATAQSLSQMDVGV